MEVGNEVEPEFPAALKIIMHWELTKLGKQMILFNHHDEQAEYLQAVDEVLHWINSTHLSDNLSRVKFEDTILVITARLEYEFWNILTTSSDNDPSGNSSRYSSCSSSSEEGWNEEDYLHIGSELSSRAIVDLRSIGQRMDTAGYLSRCTQVYKMARKATVDAHFRQLGIQRLTVGDLRWMEWEVMQTKIKEWIRAAKICVCILFEEERRLSEVIFEGLGEPDLIDECFVEIVKDSATQLFAFAEGISTIGPSTDRLFKISDLYETLMDLLPNVDSLFQSRKASFIQLCAAKVVPRLAEMVIEILSKFESALVHEISKVPPAKGGIPHLTRYVMNYITMISRKKTLVKLIVSEPSYEDDFKMTVMDSVEPEGETPLARHLAYIITALQFKLEAMSACYKDTSVGHLFKMNNFHYMAQIIERSTELKELIGDNYSRKLVGNCRHSAITYQRLTWTRVLNSLTEEGLFVKKSAVILRLKNFNAMFDKVKVAHMSLLVPDTQLRQDLRLSISCKLVMVYRSFIGRWMNYLEKKYIKYTPEDLQTAVFDMFEGHSVPWLSGRTQHTS